MACGCFCHRPWAWGQDDDAGEEASWVIDCGRVYLYPLKILCCVNLCFALPCIALQLRWVAFLCCSATAVFLEGLACDCGHGWETASNTLCVVYWFLCKHELHNHIHIQL